MGVVVTAESPVGCQASVESRYKSPGGPDAYTVRNSTTLRLAGFCRMMDPATARLNGTNDRVRGGNTGSETAQIYTPPPTAQAAHCDFARARFRPVRQSSPGEATLRRSRAPVGYPPW